ncbi:MAG: sulfotransferase [Deltaproteobacteria bacterium]|nr:sulfotransferase [Deltaproteobacteria bacterium]MBW1875406.1 sulfotransferase [Deltaproteobacteria bacterium]MBW2211361.1 sulfotransferase [Deltaproteobacteria bacterium]MBW2215244.1 sulfotransferase [Deltaproteobacteria bacterium]MBW2379242.1 sulfotransferase [Deltaproteobacteria bacterium]
MTEPPPSPRLSFPLSVVSGIADRWPGQLVPVDVDRAMRTAERVTGLCDYADDGGFGRRLHATVESLKETEWNLIGRVAVRTALRWHLINRLNLVELLKRHPELRQIELAPPIVIVGLFRTGTTFLHNIMATDPDTRAGATWELAHPVGRARDLLGDEKWRRRRTAIPLAMTRIIVPDQNVVHDVTIDAFEEDFFLLENDMAVMKFVVGFGAWQYAWRMLEWDMEESYRWHRLQLQVLSAQRSARRWVLKCPWHLWNLDALLKVYPDARIIHTHREIDKAIGSQCSLSARICGRIQRNANLHDLGRFWADYSLAGLERGLAARDRLPASQVYDVHLDALRAEPSTVLRNIYEHFGLPFDGALLQRFEQTAAEEPTFQRGVHDYRLEDFGLQTEALRQKFASYRARFSVD